MFENAPLNPPDAIFGLIEKFKQDPNPNKINLSVGVYQDESGKTPVMNAVYEAEKKLLAESRHQKLFANRWFTWLSRSNRAIDFGRCSF